MGAWKASNTGWIDIPPSPGTTIGANAYAKACVINGVMYLAIQNATRSSGGAGTMFELAPYYGLPVGEIPVLFGTGVANQVVPGWLSPGSGALRATFATGTTYRLMTAIPLGL